MRHLEFESVLAGAWDLTRKHWLGLVLLFIVYSIVSNVISNLIPGGMSLKDQLAIWQNMNNPRELHALQAEMEEYAYSPMYFVSLFISIAIGTIYEAGALNLYLRLARGQEKSVTLDAVIAAFNMPVETYLKFFCVTFCVGIASCIGFACCIIPGFFVIAAFFLVSCITLDEPQLPFVDVFKKSYEMTKGNLGTIIGLVLASIVIVVIGFICCCVGVFAAYVMTNFIIVVSYLTLKNS